MTPIEIIEIAAKNAAINIKMEIPSNNGVAIIGKLGKEELEMFGRYATDAMAAGIHQKYPAKIVKREDGKAVDIDNFLLVFTPTMMVEFVDRILKRLEVEYKLKNAPPSGNS